MSNHQDNTTEKQINQPKKRGRKPYKHLLLNNENEDKTKIVINENTSLLFKITKYLLFTTKKIGLLEIIKEKPRMIKCLNYLILYKSNNLYNELNDIKLGNILSHIEEKTNDDDFKELISQIKKNFKLQILEN
jgi:hypothetical protein